MARKNIDIGSGYDTNDGDKLRDGGYYINQNFIEIYDAENTTGSARFSSPAGNWGGSPASPLQTATIDLSLTGALNAGTACVYYKGNVLTKDSFIGGTVVSFPTVAQNREDVLCFVWIIYDKGSGAFHVNIQDTWTGDIPDVPTVTENAPTNLVLTLGDIDGGVVENAPTNLQLTEGTTVVTENAPTNINLTEGTV